MNRELLYIHLFLFLFSSSLFADMFPFQTIEKANSAYINKEFRKSARLFNSLNKKDASVAYNRANAYYKAGMYNASERSYLQAKGVDESLRTYNLGNVYFQQGEFDKAIASYKLSLTLREDEDTRFNLELAKHKKEEKQKKSKSNKKNIEKRKAQYQKSKENRRVDKEVNNEERIRKEELTHLLNQVSKKKMPTMFYLIESEKGEDNDKNPW